MKIKSLGHVVIRVSDLARSEAFYRDVLGLPVCAHYDKDGLNMAFFTLGDHHDFAIMENKALGEETHSGLDHVAFKIGESLDELVAAKRHLEANGLITEPINHDVTKSLYISDPDGNGIELYVDVSDAWRRDPDALVRTLEPLDI
jgi:catechol 2,3-dioxygenase